MAILALVLPVGALLLVFGQLVKRTGAALIRTGRQSRPRAGANAAPAATLVAALTWAWWPAGQWTPSGRAIKAPSSVPS